MTLAAFKVECPAFALGCPAAPSECVGRLEATRDATRGAFMEVAARVSPARIVDFLAALNTAAFDESNLARDLVEARIGARVPNDAAWAAISKLWSLDLAIESGVAVPEAVVLRPKTRVARVRARVPRCISRSAGSPSAGPA